MLKHFTRYKFCYIGLLLCFSLIAFVNILQVLENRKANNFKNGLTDKLITKEIDEKIKSFFDVVAKQLNNNANIDDRSNRMKDNINILGEFFQSFVVLLEKLDSPEVKKYIKEQKNGFTSFFKSKKNPLIEYISHLSFQNFSFNPRTNIFNGISNLLREKDRKSAEYALKVSSEDELKKEITQFTRLLLLSVDMNDTKSINELHTFIAEDKEIRKVFFQLMMANFIIPNLIFDKYSSKILELMKK